MRPDPFIAKQPSHAPDTRPTVEIIREVVDDALDTGILPTRNSDTKEDK